MNEYVVSIEVKSIGSHSAYEWKSDTIHAGTFEEAVDKLRAYYRNSGYETGQEKAIQLI